MAPTAEVAAPSTRPRGGSRGLLLGLSAMLFVTGACGLVYQQLWLRELSLVFGVTVYAAATVLAAFMAGLALGSWLAGRVIDRVRRPLAWFGVCEALVGLIALVTPTAMRALEDLYVATAGGPDTPLPVLTGLRLVYGFAVLLLPATLMGASMPIVIRAAVSHSGELGTRTALLYSVNTTGAIFGTLLAGFVLIGELGLWRTFVLAALGNLVVGAVALVASRRITPAVAGPVTEVPSRPAVDESAVSAAAMPLGARRAVMATFVISGFVTLGLEIVWFRVLVLYLESNTYAFSAMLALVLAGIAIGSAIVTPALRRRADWYTVLIVIEALLAVVALGSLAFLARSFDVRDAMPVGGSITLVASALAVFPTALLMGIAFPIGVMLWAGSDPDDGAEVGRRVGVFYAGNLVGAIAGSLVAGFVLIPAIGTRASVVLLSALVLAAVGLLVTADPSRARVTTAAVAAAAFLLVTVVAVPDPNAAPVANRYGGATELTSTEGVQATVSVFREPGGERRMFIDGLPQASTDPGVADAHRLIGALPVLLHENPREVLIVGLGGGVTAGAAAAVDDVDATVVELSEEVVDAARWFSSVNEDVTDRPNVDFRVDDGRNYLLLADTDYDVITADIIQPEHAGAGKVWSVEYWRLVRDALADDGIVLQWVGTDRPAEHWDMIVRSFLEVFPDATLWGDGAFLVGAKQPLRLDEAALRSKFADPRFAGARERAGIPDADALLDLYTAGPDELRRMVGAGPLLTDDRPRIEYFRSLDESGARRDFTGRRADVREVLG